MDKKFVGRKREIERIQIVKERDEASILVVYGRRRVGKTSLIEKCFGDRNLLKFEGLEKRDAEVQREIFFEQLARYFKDPKLSKLSVKSWREAFIILNDYIKKDIWTVYLEEFQWLANYKDELVSDLKYVWDNFWSKNSKLILIICGSAPSFIINHVMKSKALYNRSQYEFPVEELNLLEAQELLGQNKSLNETLDAYLAVGGIPEYLHYLKNSSSIYLSLCKNSFIKGSFFSNEADRIFVSSLSDKPIYRAIIEKLGQLNQATKKELIQKIKYTSGGQTANFFNDLETCGFLGNYSPLSFGTKSRSSKVFISDSYLQFYYKFIKPNLTGINQGDFNDTPTYLLPNSEYRQWMGYSFERFCLKQHRTIAKILGFEAIRYTAGPYYLRTQPKAGQIDLVFDRKDKVLTVCEIKYKETPPGKELIEEFEKKLKLLDQYRNKKIRSLHKVLISPNGAAKSLVDTGYFDRIVRIDDFFNYMKV